MSENSGNDRRSPGRSIQSALLTRTTAAPDEPTAAQSHAIGVYRRHARQSSASSDPSSTNGIRSTIASRPAMGSTSEATEKTTSSHASAEVSSRPTKRASA
ncbi:hypothetical protein BE18_28925 [Sorangium cellulosum]|uniref:Uncharacterized protein n=1 Tax=Sorangium cellulosum TaxID=56 RepID=A0A150RUZ3_SORCE|nr:hypothetical protein BE18_28925 [Sorangium cellulosum]